MKLYTISAINFVRNKLCRLYKTDFDDPLSKVFTSIFYKGYKTGYKEGFNEGFDLGEYHGRI